MIVSASRRTDIPCFYSDWFMNRIKAGYVLTRNPMNRSQIHRVSLLPDDVDCFVFWTKDPLNIMDKLSALDEAGYKYYFQFTLTPYGNDVEKGLRDKHDIEDTFIQLSKTIGIEKVLWRSDPIILNDELNIVYHKKQFERLCRKLSPFTKSVIISFADNYAKLKTDIIKEIPTSAMTELAGIFSEVAERYALSVKTCCEKIDLSKFNILHSACIDKNLIEQICGHPLSQKPDKSQRPGCGCCASVDIGAYNTCLNGCVYCYANYSIESVKKNILKHLADGELLMGEVGEDDKIYERKS